MKSELERIKAVLDFARLNGDLPQAAQLECYEAMVHVARALARIKESVAR